VFGERIDRKWLFDYVNVKFLKLSDISLDDLLTNAQDHVVVTRESKKSLDKFLKENVKDIKKEEVEKIQEFVHYNFDNKAVNLQKVKSNLFGLDTKALLPIKEHKKIWNDLYGKAQVTEEPIEK
jgi:hypothetical protein